MTFGNWAILLFLVAQGLDGIFTDGVGTSRFLEHVFALYHDPSYTMPPLDVSFRDCILALAEMSNSELGSASERYWRDRIPDWPDAPPIPMVSGSSTVGRSELSRRELVLSPRDWAALRFPGRSPPHGYA